MQARPMGEWRQVIGEWGTGEAGGCGSAPVGRPAPVDLMDAREGAERQLAEATAQQPRAARRLRGTSRPRSAVGAGRCEATTAEHPTRGWAVCAGKGHALLKNDECRMLNAE